MAVVVRVVVGAVVVRVAVGWGVVRVVEEGWGEVAKGTVVRERVGMGGGVECGG